MDPLDIIRQIEADDGLRAQLRAVLLGDDFLTLPAEIKKLVEAQMRTDESVKKLFEAQARTDESVKKLAEAQMRTDESVKNLAIQVGKLSEVVGGTVETDAQQVIDYLI
jgi:hypothetical protein